jgi:hypothetical protein
MHHQPLLVSYREALVQRHPRTSLLQTDLLRDVLSKTDKVKHVQ